MRERFAPTVDRRKFPVITNELVAKAISTSN